MQSDIYGFANNTYGWHEMESDYGVLPMPKFTEDQPYYGVIDHFTSMMMIPINTNNEDNIGLIVEALTRGYYNEVLDVIYDNIEYATRDDESIEMVKLVHQTFVNDPVNDTIAYATNGAVYGLAASLLQGVLMEGGDFSALYEANYEGSTIALDEFQGKSTPAAQ